MAEKAGRPGRAGRQSCRAEKAGKVVRQGIAGKQSGRAEQARQSVDAVTQAGYVIAAG
jgi:hypothetical protein